MTTIGQTLSRRRRELGIPFDDLAVRSGVSVATVKRILGGQIGKASFEHVARVAEAMGVSLVTRQTPAAAVKRAAARRQAERLVGMVQGTSGLEGQAISDKAAEALVRQSVRRLLAGPPRRVWAQ